MNAGHPAIRDQWSQAAWAKFQAICDAQGGLRQPGVARLQEPVVAWRTGHVSGIDSRQLARAAKLAGAPGELTYAKNCLTTHPVITLAEQLAQ